MDALKADGIARNMKKTVAARASEFRVVRVEQAVGGAATLYGICQEQETYRAAAALVFPEDAEVFALDLHRDGVTLVG